MTLCTICLQPCPVEEYLENDLVCFECVIEPETFPLATTPEPTHD